MKETLGKVGYGALFVVVLPAVLLWWAGATAKVVTLPVIRSLPLGAALAVAGGLVVVSGWYALWHHGGGLPMNAFPPPRHVTRGPYALLPHPIYAGGAAVSFGASIAAGSASGFWLVSPALLLASIALVLGYEGRDLRARFGAVAARPWLSLPPDDDAPPAFAERAAMYLLVIAPWCAVYEAIAAAGPPPDAISTRRAVDDLLPLWESTEAVYASTYLLVLAAPIAAAARRDLRRFAVEGLLASALIFPLYLALPLVAPPRPFDPHGPLGVLLQQERAWDTPACAFPSFHVVWAFIASSACASRFPRIRWFFRVLPWAISFSCLTTGMHTVADVVAGVLAYALVRRHRAVWETLRHGAERIANSWQERQLGPARFINHGGWAALGAGGGFAAIGALLGPGHTLSIVVAATAGLAGAALWAQLVEGSPALLRPYGFYGGLLGIVVGTLAAPLTGTGTWPLLAAFTVAAPWIQAMGRLRCLVQGCCHGQEAPAWIGIRYTHPRSRVCRLSPLGGVPVHPTPLYSILWNVVIALALSRLWSLGVPVGFIAGTYLLLGGLGRFVEEAYRGEPQTPVHAGLRLYQWAALASALAGIVLTGLAPGGAAPTPRLDGISVPGAIAWGVAIGIALGVDFPGSSRRFSRLV